MITLKGPQWDVFDSDARFRILVAGRRFGKTYLSMVELIRAAWAPGRLAWYVGPSYRQAKRIAWKPLKEMTRPYWAAAPNETDLRIELQSGGSICLRGADRYESLRGNGLDFLVLDEYASIAREAWPEVLRPALADRQGRALLTGTPRGHDHFHELFCAAREMAPEWRAFQFTTQEGGNVRAEELASATRQLDERTFRQEFEASFDNAMLGRVYYAFDRKGNTAKAEYDPRLPIFWALDFNVDPMCSVIGQQEDGRVTVLDEIMLRDSHTGAACEEFARRVGQWGRVTVQVYGDASGKGRRSSSTQSDWQIVREFLSARGYGMSWRVGEANPQVRDRTNCVNALLCSQSGERRLVVDEKCRELIRDFEQVKWKNGDAAAGLDKSDGMRSHLSDALGYLVEREHGMRGKGGFGGKRLI